MVPVKNRKLVLEDGTEIYGYGFGSREEKFLEIVFNTSMTGYQELMSDPSYTGQAVVMTYPLIGNYGMADDDYETKIPSIGALVVREYCDEPSNFRCTKTLGKVMEKYHVAGICGVDTRMLTRHIRNYGSCKVVIADAAVSKDECLKRMEKALPIDYVAQVSRKEAEFYGAEDPKYKVVAIDCGIKQNIIRSMNRIGCDVEVVPYNTSADVIKGMKPDGIFISNGPGDPTDVKCVIETVKELKGKYPIFGICLGHQIISLAYGAQTYKLKFGHRGGNHPVKNLLTDKLEITSQNHSYAVDPEGIKNTGLSISHINLLDNTVEGVYSSKDRIFGVQYHPESAPGPQDSGYLFRRFIELMEGKELYGEESENA